MNEQQQAELLARWLEDRTGPPDGLDAEVVESITALKPELAPPPSLSVEDILATITEGPLAAAPSIPVGASLGASPEEAPVAGSSARGRPWWMVVAGVGGMSSVAAAAALLLVFGVGGGLLLTGQNSESPPMEVAGSAARPAPAPLIEAPPLGQAVAMADTGLVPGKAAPKREPSNNRPRRPQTAAAAKPSPITDPSSMADPSPVPSLGYGAEAADAEPDAVAWGGDDFVDDADAERDDQPEADLDRRQMIPEITEALSKTETRAGGRGEELLLSDEEAVAEERLSRTVETEKAVESVEAKEGQAASKKRKRADTGGESAKDERSKQSSKGDDQAPAAAPMAPMEPSPEVEQEVLTIPRPAPAPPPAIAAPVETSSATPVAAGPPPPPPPRPPAADPVGGADSLSMPADDAAREYRVELNRRQEAHRGTEGVVDHEVDNARVLIAAGEPQLAIDACENALDQHRSPSRVRQLLFALQGDAWAALDNSNKAERAWRKAIQVRDSL